jgi:putative regulator of septum formation
VLSALERERSPASESIDRMDPQSRGRTDAGATGRAVLLTVLTGLLIAGVVAVVEIGDHHASRPAKKTDSRADVVFSSARSGDCLTWPTNSPGEASFVSCKDDHLFEVAESVDMRSFQAPCEQAVRRYLGSHYDPNSGFTISVLWSGDAAGTQSGERRVLCGLQLLGPQSQPIPFKGTVAELVESKVRPEPPNAPPGIAAPPAAPPIDAPGARPITPPAVAGTPTATPNPVPTVTSSGLPTPIPIPSPTASPGPSPAVIPASPSPEAPPTTTQVSPSPPVLEIPGLPPITLPVLPPSPDAT